MDIRYLESKIQNRSLDSFGYCSKYDARHSSGCLKTIISFGEYPNSFTA